MSSSATLPRIHTATLANACFLLTNVSSVEGNCVPIPNADIRGIIVALWINRLKYLNWVS